MAYTTFPLADPANTRKALGFTQSQVAEMAHVSKVTVSKWERRDQAARNIPQRNTWELFVIKAANHINRVSPGDDKKVRYIQELAKNLGISDICNAVLGIKASPVSDMFSVDFVSD